MQQTEIITTIVGCIVLSTALSQQSAAADTDRMVGTWVVDFQKTAESLGDADKAKGLLAGAAGGLQIQMVFRPDGSTRVTKAFGDESEQRDGTYKIIDKKAEELTLEVASRFAGLRFEQIYQTPDQYLHQAILMTGTFREHYEESESFGLAQGDYVIEVFYEKLSDEQKETIKSPKDGEPPVAVGGVLAQSSVEDDEVYYIEATGIKWGADVMGTDHLVVKFLGKDLCQMGAPGDDLLLVWKRVK